MRPFPSFAVLLACAGAHAQIDPNSGIDFVNIGAPGNAAFQSPFPNDFVNGRGGVAYEYKIGRTEVPTALWVEFFNAAYDRPANDRIPHLLPPNYWGAVPTTPQTPGGLRWTVPAGNEVIPVGNISWRTAAILCNWLHNGKSTAREAFLDGAYDVSTFGFNGTFNTDQATHHAGATYWIPTWDEWLKAAHYDPNKNGPGEGGWWRYSNGSDTPYLYGPPGVGEANAGFTFPNPFTIPLGAYPAVQSPWGLLDVAGATTEWTESILTIDTGQRYRVFDGSYWGLDGFVSSLMDGIRDKGAEYPYVPTSEFGFRIASSVPAPGTWAVVAGVLCMIGSGRRRGSARLYRGRTTFPHAAHESFQCSRSGRYGGISHDR